MQSRNSNSLRIADFGGQAARPPRDRASSALAVIGLERMLAQSMPLGRGPTRAHRQWAERQQHAALRSGFIGRGHLQEHILLARLGP